jgi:hypothetical protein
VYVSIFKKILFLQVNKKNHMLTVKYMCVYYSPFRQKREHRFLFYICDFNPIPDYGAGYEKIIYTSRKLGFPEKVANHRYMRVCPTAFSYTLLKLPSIPQYR